MGIFSSIMDKIFHHPSASTPAGSDATGSAGSGGQSAAPTSAQPASSSSSGAGGSAGTAPASKSVDVEAVLTNLAQSKGGGGNWRTSIVDLLKLLDLDSSLSARKELANELNVHAGADGSAEQNIALHKAVMQKLAENGGKVPESLRH